MFDILIPVYNGGGLFLSALGSVIEKAPTSATIFISFNGDSDKDYKNFSSFVQTNKTAHRIVVNRTFSNLSSTQHALQIDFWLSRHKSNCELVMVLCHDDEILSFPEKICFEECSGADCVFFPKWICIDEKVPSISKEEVLFESLSEIPQNVIFGSFQSNMIFTSISGMVFPKRLLSTYCRWLTVKKTGARMELMLASHRRVRILKKLQNLDILVRQRDDSDGKTIRFRECCWDEMVFLVWLFFNFRILNGNDLSLCAKRFKWAFQGYLSRH